MGTKSNVDTFPRNRYVVGLEEVDRTQVAVVGGKGAQLGELSRIDGVCVPAGFCATTDAFGRVMADATSTCPRRPSPASTIRT